MRSAAFLNSQWSGCSWERPSTAHLKRVSAANSGTPIQVPITPIRNRLNITKDVHPESGIQRALPLWHRLRCECVEIPYLVFWTHGWRVRVTPNSGSSFYTIRARLFAADSIPVTRCINRKARTTERSGKVNCTVADALGILVL